MYIFFYLNNILFLLRVLIVGLVLYIIYIIIIRQYDILKIQFTLYIT